MIINAIRTTISRMSLWMRITIAMDPRLSSLNYLLQVHHHHYCGHVVVCLVHESLVPSYKQINDIENDQQ